MYGYFTSYGYRGLVQNEWMLFATEAEYVEYVNELKRRNLAKTYYKNL